jgi:7-cyano-7-deazaguanine synthase
MLSKGPKLTLCAQAVSVSRKIGYGAIPSPPLCFRESLLVIEPKHALVLFSGGQDSTACVAWALSRYDRVETIGFDYGQRHRVELDQRLVILEAIRASMPGWVSKLGDDHLLDLGLLGQISDTALTRDTAIVMAESGLPTTFVPGRNLVFLTFAGALAYRRGLGVLVGGMCETDFSGYPDCRRTTLDAMEQALSLGMDVSFKLATPLMYLTKAQTWDLAFALGGQALVDLTIEHSHTCYTGDRTLRHDWGYGCGICPACELRAAGWQQWQAQHHGQGMLGARVTP